MQVHSAGTALVQSIMPKTPEPTEGAGPDTDGDGDDSGSSVKSMTAPGVGQAVDTSV